MPFGLTNAPSTFQSLMNSIFQPYLRQFILVFFDDILIYLEDWSTHLTQLQLVLEMLRQNQLYVKMSKCAFRASKVEYLGHIISYGKVFINATKVTCTVNWLIPKSVKELRGFFRLTSYCRWFIKDYTTITRPSLICSRRITITGLTCP